MVDHETLKATVTYDPDTGFFAWRHDIGRRFKAGARCGHRHSNGYIIIRLRRRGYTAARLAWMYVNGTWPAGEVDHINGDKSDNRISNLRVATRLQNEANKLVGKRTTTGHRGVGRSACRKKWLARIRIKSKLVHLGTFDTLEAASNAYKDACERVHGEYAGHLNRGNSSQETCPG